MKADRFIAPFKPWHYDWLAASSAASDGGERIAMPAATLAELEGQNSWTGVLGGVPLFCAGTMRQWAGRHAAWAYLAYTTGPHMRWITTQVKQNLGSLSGRIEMTVRADFVKGVRWAYMLGFKPESLMAKYGPSGEDHFMFVRFN